MNPVMAHGEWKTNGAMIADAARLGYLDGHVLDPTYGLGLWWTDWKPERLTASDLDINKSPLGTSVDFTDLPWKDETFDAVAYDPPYKLQGSAHDKAQSNRFGVDVRRTRDELHALMNGGLRECARVTKTGGCVLAKCQDQIEGGKMRWQTDMLTRTGMSCCLLKVDRLQMPSYRAQPSGRNQRHARNNFSTLLIFRKVEDR